MKHRVFIFSCMLLTLSTQLMPMSLSLHHEAVQNINVVAKKYEIQVEETKEREEKHAVSEMQLDIQEQEALNKSLRIAAFSHDFDSVDTLIACGADVNAGNQDGTTPLMSAVHASPAMVEKLIRSGAWVDKKDARGLTAGNHAEYWFLQPRVQWFMESESTWDIAAILTKLVALGSSVDILDSAQTTAYKKAIAAGSEAYTARKTEIEQLRSHNERLAQKAIAREKELFEQRRQLEEIERRHEQLKHAPDVSVKLLDEHEIKRAIRLQFHIAIERGDTELVLDIVNRYGDDSEIFHIPPICYAILHNNRIYFEHQLARVSDVNMRTRGFSILEYAILHRRNEMVMKLIEAGAVFDATSEVSYYLKELAPGVQEVILSTVNGVSKGQAHIKKHAIKNYLTASLDSRAADAYAPQAGSKDVANLISDYL